MKTNNSKKKNIKENINYVPKSDDLPKLIELVDELEKIDTCKYFFFDVDKRSKKFFIIKK